MYKSNNTIDSVFIHEVQRSKLRQKKEKNNNDGINLKCTCRLKIKVYSFTLREFPFQTTKFIGPKYDKKSFYYCEKGGAVSRQKQE